MDIRKCTEKDITPTGIFYDTQILHMDESDSNYPLWIYKVYPSEESVKECTENGSQYIYEEDGEIRAAFVLNDEPGGKYENGCWKRGYKRGEYLVIHSLAVDYRYAGKGIGRRVVEFCLNAAEKAGFKAVRVDVVPTNIPAARLYEKAGFTYAGTVDLERGIKNIPRFSLYEYNF